MKEFRIGCSGWSYGDWAGRFYPKGTSPREFLRYYSERFDTVEIDMTFYRFPSGNAVRAWTEATPAGFVFAVKMNRTITHYRRLEGVEDQLGSFVGLVKGLGSKLGPILVQLPPGPRPDHDLLERFLSLLPGGARYAFEFRDPRWYADQTYRLLERYEAALCLGDSPVMAPMVRSTTDFAYVRWHGRSGADHDYSEQELVEWADALDDLSVDIAYGYFNNDIGGNAPSNAQTLLGLLKGRTAISIIDRTN